MAPSGVNSIATLKRWSTTGRFSKPAAIAPESAKTDPTDKSIPPDKMTSVIPSDRHRLTEICRSTFVRLSTVKKASERIDKATTATASARSD